MSSKTYDSRCYDLAATFLSDQTEINDEPHRRQLASEIQQLIEDYIAAATEEKQA